LEKESIKQAFQDCYNQDKNQLKIPYWMNHWETSAEMHNFNGVEDFEKWFEWATFPKPHYFSDEDISHLVNKSQSFHKKLIDKLSLDIDLKDHEVNSVYNAQDYLFQNLYPVPARMEIHRILDFGAGYGRQANLWTQLRDDIVYVGMDAVELPYCLQYLYYNYLDLPLHEYVEEKNKFKIENKPGIYHLPTWRYDLLPDDFFDMIICIQVLHELDETLLKEMIKVFYKILRTGGMLYIRDHDLAYTPGNRLDLSKYLPKNGFTLEFKPHIIDREELHGIPQIWRKTDRRVIESQKPEELTLKSLVNRIIKLEPKINRKVKNIYHRYSKYKTNEK
jgi:SAM-dependent methyltransferase